MGFSIGSFYCLTQRNQNLHPFNFLRGVFARGGTEYMSIQFFFFRHLQSAYLDASVFGGWSGDMKGGGEREEGRLEVQSHAAAQGQWVRGTQPEHTWRAG